jgi:hypothetical protein
LNLNFSIESGWHARQFHQRLDYMHWNPVRKGLVNKPADWQWSSYNNFAVDAKVVADCPIQIDDVRLPEGYRGRPGPNQRKAHGQLQTD